MHFALLLFVLCLDNVTGLNVSAGEDAGVLVAEWFSVSSTTRYRLEYAPMGSTVTTNQVIPPDSGGSGRVQYTIERLSGFTSYNVMVAAICEDNSAGSFTSAEATTRNTGILNLLMYIRIQTKDALGTSC